MRSATQEFTENLFEIEDLQLTMPDDICQQDNSTMTSHARKKEEVHGSPVDQPLRRAVEKIYPYKEVSLSTKMRRS